MAKIKGENSILYIHDGTAYRPAACLTSNGLDTTLGVIEAQTKCAPGVIEKQAGIFSYTISADAICIDTTSVGGDTAKASHDYLLDVQLAGGNVDWKMTTGIAGLVYYGNGILDSLGLSNPAGDEFSTFTLSINGNGTIVKEDPKAVAIPIMTSASTIEISTASSGTFQVTAENPPLTSFAITGSTPLPTGVTLNAITGLISWTTGRTVGTTVVSLQIFNSAGWSTNSITFNVS